MPERPIYIEVKSAAVPPHGEVRYTWWVTVDAHPFSDQIGYQSENNAKAAAELWVQRYYPSREISYDPATV